MPVSFDKENVQLALKAKLPKAVWGPFEIGTKLQVDIQSLIASQGPALVVEASDATTTSGGGDSTTSYAPLNALQRSLKATFTVKDIYLRGKLSIDPATKRIIYSKKLRVPFLQTELFRASAIADYSAGSGVLSPLLGLRLSFSTEALHARSVVRKDPVYSLQLRPKLPLPSLVMGKLPGSLYVQAGGAIHVTDADSLQRVALRADLREAALVWRAYSCTSEVKPCATFRRAKALAWQPLSASPVGGAVFPTSDRSASVADAFTSQARNASTGVGGGGNSGAHEEWKQALETVAGAGGLQASPSTGLSGVSSRVSSALSQGSNRITGAKGEVKGTAVAAAGTVTDVFSRLQGQLAGAGVAAVDKAKAWQHHLEHSTQLATNKLRASIHLATAP